MCVSDVSEDVPRIEEISGTREHREVQEGENRKEVEVRVK